MSRADAWLKSSVRPCLMALTTMSISVAAPAAELLAGATGFQHDVVFTQYSPMSRSVEIKRRLLSPLANAEVARALARSATGLREQAIDLNMEAFAVYVPPTAPPAGYALLVFIPPWQSSYLPAGWASVLNKHGVIFVSASKSGNDENVLDRRIPLALLGAFNVMQLYPVAKDRVYIGGFSGGSRVALRVALGYPDLFHGAMLNAGSDRLGSEQLLLPAADLFNQFQSSIRLVYITGSEDSSIIQTDIASRDSAYELCVFGTTTHTMIRVGHEIADPASLDRELSTLSARAAPEEAKLTECRQHLEKAMSEKLQGVKDLLDRDKSHDASKLLTKIDIRYGGLVAPESVNLAGRIGAPLAK
jgi:hypothetical protein